MKKNLKIISTLVRWLGWPLRLFDTRTRLAFGLAMTVFSLVMLSETLGVLPSHNAPVMKARKLQTETLALTGTAVAESNRDLSAFKRVLTNALERAEGLISIGLRKANGELDIVVGPHEQSWKKPESGRSNDRFMFVPIYRGRGKVGQLELCYRGLGGAGAWIQSSTARLALFMAAVSFLVFNLLLARTLKQLDPRGAVPQRVREAFDNMAEGLLLLDRRGQIMLANGKFGALVGIDHKGLVGTMANDFQWESKEDRLPWERSSKELATISESILQIADAKGNQRTFNVSSAPIIGHGGKCRGVMVTFDDITVLEEQRRELVAARNEADAANEAKSNFLSRMSHEIRTPMNAIIGYTDILQQGNVDRQEQVRYLTTIQSSGEHLLELINDVLDLSKIEAGQMTVERRSVALFPLLSQVIETLNVKAIQKGLTLESQVEGRIPPQVETDDTRLKQILINTIGNAIKFTSDGGVKLISRIKESGARPMLEFAIVDTGIGMSSEALDSIFDPFTQADDSVTRKFGGTGLGLSISKQLAESLGGGIRVKSQPGVGTVFTVSIDPGQLGSTDTWLDAGEVVDLSRTDPLNARVARRSASGHVLIVDDSQANRDLAAVMLRRVGMTADTAQHGLEALQKLAAGKVYDVVLMDMNMPTMDGLAATMELRKKGNTIPVVALTANVMESERKKCLEAGFDDFLPKPIRRESLLNVMSRFVQVVTEDQKQQNTEPVQEKVTTPVHTDSKILQLAPPLLAITNAASLASDSSIGIEASITRTLASLGVATGASLMVPADSNNLAPADPVDLLTLPTTVRSTLPEDAEFNAIITEFSQRLPSKIDQFSVALKNKDRKLLGDLGHWLVGAAATVGFEDFVPAAREIEGCQNVSQERLEQLVEHIRALCARIELPGATAT